jgi:hypothetical protein
MLFASHAAAERSEELGLSAHLRLRFTSATASATDAVRPATAIRTAAHSAVVISA